MSSGSGSDGVEDLFQKYKHRIRNAKSHSAKEIILLDFLSNVFELDDLALYTEIPLKDKIKNVRGRADLIYGGVVLEVKVNLDKEIKEAEKELTKYLKILHDKEKKNFVGIATDGITFRAYILHPKEGLKKISEFKVNDNLKEFILWLDSYFFTSRNVKPTAEDLQVRFGLGSPTFSIATMELLKLYEKVSDKPHVKLKYELWEKHLEIVYGKAPDIEEFIVHTYLVTLVKIIMYLRLKSSNGLGSLEKVLDGSYFRDVSGIINFIEEDFFTWVLEEEIKDQSLKLIGNLAKELEIYDFERADEDLFKEIYQDIIGPSARHRIGEYYTPEWLAQLTLERAIKRLGKDYPKILDPACGSGTFITNAIHYYKNKSKSDEELLELILSNVVGMDINPLAVIIARANYMLALGELLKHKREPIVIPVYLADSIRLPEGDFTLLAPNIMVYRVEVESNRYLAIPEDVISNEKELTRILDKMRELLEQYKIGRLDEKGAKIAFETYLKERNMDDGSLQVLLDTYKKIIYLINKGRDSIWIFIIGNIYAPIRLRKEKVDLIVGNPPWIALRYIENKIYQERLKRMIIEDYKLLDKNDKHLFTQMEVATLFFMRTADLYLKDGGIVAFVMPKSVLTGAKQHSNFRTFKKPKIELLEIIDCHYSTKFKVEPLFNVPCAVLIGKRGSNTKYPVKAIALSGRLNKKNAKLDEIELDKKEYSYEPPIRPTNRSYYYDLFRAGASIYPRPLWFVDIVEDQRLGINPLKPRVKSSEDAIKNAKGNWKKVIIEGNVEKEFIFVTLLSRNLIPFGYRKLSPIVLPIKVKDGVISLLSRKQLKGLGKLGMAMWVEKAQEYWDKYATEKDKRNFPRVEESLNHLGLLEVQNLKRKFVVVSASSGTHTSSCVINRAQLSNIAFHHITHNGIIMEKTTFYYETDVEDEAYYLSAIINSRTIDEHIKPLQAKGSFGERHIQRIIFELPIPRFDPSNETHLRLSELGKLCHEKVNMMTKGSRSQIKEMLGKYMDEIDKLVADLLKLDNL